MGEPQQRPKRETLALATVLVAVAAGSGFTGGTAAAQGQARTANGSGVVTGNAAHPAHEAPAPAAEPAGPSPRRAATADGAHVVSEHWINPSMLDLRIFSPAVGDEVPVRLLLPRDWQARPDASWPTLYLLDGFNDPRGYTVWTETTDVARFMGDKNVLTVLPGDGKVGAFTNWWNRGSRGQPGWETFHTRELPQILHRAYHSGNRQAIAGLSLGGYGAMKYAADNPGMYGAASSYSGVLHTTMPTIPPIMQRVLRSGGDDPERVWGDPQRHRSVWRANDPWWQAAGLRGTRVFLSAASGLPGKHDPTLLQNLEALYNDPRPEVRREALATSLEQAASATTHSFQLRLNSFDIPVTTDYRITGTHSWSYWQDALHRSWPTLAAGLGLATS